MSTCCLTPTVQGEAPLGLNYTGDHRFQSIWTQLRIPAITLPTNAGPNGLPVGIQLVGAELRRRSPIGNGAAYISRSWPRSCYRGLT